MITLESVDYPQGYFLSGTKASSFFLGSNSRGYNVSPLAVHCPFQGLSAAKIIRKIPFGSLVYPNDKRWGGLRDRDVIHTSGYGTIQADALALSKIQEDDPNFVHFGYHLRGTVRHEFTSCAVWGGDAEDVSLVRSVSYTHSTKGAATSRPFPTYSWVKFDGDFMIRYLGPWNYTVDYASGAASDVYTYVPSHLQMVKRIPVVGQNTYTWRYRNFSVGAGKLVKLPDGKTYHVDDIPVDEAYWSPYVYTTISYPLYSELTTVDPEGLEPLFTIIGNRLTDDSQKGKISRMLHSVSVPPDIIGDLGYDILNQHRRVDANILITLYELASMRVDAVPWRDFVKLLRHGHRAIKQGLATVDQFKNSLTAIAKSGSSLFLGVQYGVKTTLRDVELIRGAAAEVAAEILPPQRLHSRRYVDHDSAKGSLMSVYSLTVEVDQLPKDFLGGTMDAIRTLWSWGLWPDAEMAWDFIPFSFVVDWVFDIQTPVEHFDAQVWKEYYPIHYCITSEKRTWSVSCKDLWPDLSGMPEDWTLQFTRYHRWCEKDLPLPTIQWSDNDRPFDHWAEAGALVCQRVL
jgi:hypothetical protein